MPFGDVLQSKETSGGFGKVLGGSKGITSGFGLKKADLETTGGLQALSKKVGLGEEAQNILSEKGEEPKKIYSGGIVSDIFDTLNALQYGVTGVLKGKSFSEGVKTRQSFSDKDSLGEKGTPGVIGGILLDIAVDPLTYIPVFGWGKAIVKGAKGILGATGKTIAKVPVAKKIGDTLGRAFIYRFGQDPIYKEIAERSIKNINIGIDNVMNVARPLGKLDGATQRIVANARKLGKLEELPEELLSKAKPAFDELDRLGKEAVRVGLLKPEVYQENVGKYVARLYRSKEIPEGIAEKINTLFNKKPVRIDISRFKKRTDIPEDIREAMGEILEAGYPTAKSLVQLTQAIERAKFFKEVGVKWGKEVAEEGFEKLPDVKTLGDLANKFVPKPIYDDIQEIIRQKGKFEKNLGKVVAGFKFGKVILNPPTHARNIVSNFILNNFEGLSPVRLDIYGEAAKELVKKGKWYQEAKGVGLGLDTFASREIKDLLTGPESASFLRSFGSKAKNIVNKVADLYQKEEEFAKLAQYIFQRKSGKTVDEAWKIAERATFNYSQVTPFIRRLRESIFGYPFITFTYKATPQVVKTALTKPTKISNIGKIKQGIENMSDMKELERERKSEPSWVRDGFYVKLPVKDKYGRSAYLDLTYILPFGDLVSGNFFERGVKRETGLPEGVVESQIQKLPFPNLVRELVKNQDFYGNKIFRESDSTEKQLGDIMRHIVKVYSPPLISEQIPGGYQKSGERRVGTLKRALETEKKIEEGGTQTRTLQQELLRLIGLKISPVDIKLQERFYELEQKRAIETLLKERGVISEFTKPFIPK